MSEQYDQKVAISKLHTRIDVQRKEIESLRSRLAEAEAENVRLKCSHEWSVVMGSDCSECRKCGSVRIDAHLSRERT